MLIRKLWRTIWQYKAQFISMIIMILLGVGAFIGFQVEWRTIEKNTQDFYNETGLADYRVYNSLGFTKEINDKFKGKEGIENSTRYFASNVDVKDSGGDTVALGVTEDKSISGYYIVKGRDYNDEATDEILLSDKYAEINGYKLNDEITLSFNGKELKGKVVGLIKAGEQTVCVRDFSQIMPDYKTHGFAYVSKKAYENCIGMEFYPYIYVKSELDKSEFSLLAQEIMNNKPLIITKEEVTSYAGPKGEVEEGKTMASLLPPIFLLIAILTMVTTMHRLVANEKVQIGTLKALGFKDRKILFHYTLYALIIGLIGGVLGIGLGFLIGYMIINPDGSMGTYLDMPVWRLSLPAFAIPVVVAIVLLLGFIGYLSTRKMLKGTASDALRPYTPKKVKPLLIEKTKLFHKLSFGVRWNLRDTSRHKVRTAMSLIGVIGCVIIMIGVLGMKDSVNYYVKSYYQDSMKYASRIYLTENLTKEQSMNLVNSYDGDYSQSIGMDYNGESIMTEIHHCEKDMIRFVLENGDEVKFNDKGAYISIRVRDKFNLKKGDTITVTPYGTDKEYNIKIEGILRSGVEGMFMSDSYAESISLPFNPDSIYTNTLKDDVLLNEFIKTVQSREMITSSFDTFMEIMYMMISLLVVVGIVLGVVVLYNLGVMMYTERYRELATLKVVGFKDKRLGRLLHGQTIWTAVVGLIIGVPSGIGILHLLVMKLGARYEMATRLTPLTVILSIILTMAVTIVVSLMTARKNKKIDMVSALKGRE